MNYGGYYNGLQDEEGVRVGGFDSVREDGFSSNLGRVGRDNQEALMGGFAAGIQGQTEARKAEAYSRAMTAREKAGGSSGLLSTLGSIGSSFLGPIGAAAGKGLFG